MIRQTAISRGNHDGNTTSTICGIGLIGMTISSLLYTTCWKFGCTSVLLVWAPALGNCEIGFTPHSWHSYYAEAVFSPTTPTSSQSWAKHGYEWSHQSCVHSQATVANVNTETKRVKHTQRPCWQTWFNIATFAGAVYKHNCVLTNYTNGKHYVCLNRSSDGSQRQHI